MRTTIIISTNRDKQQRYSHVATTSDRKMMDRRYQSAMPLPEKDVSDTESVGFVDIEDLMELDRDFISSDDEISLPYPPRPKGLAAIVAWLEARQQAAQRKRCCYSNQAAEPLFRPHKVSVEHIVLPLPPVKKPSRSDRLLLRLQKLLVCC